MGNKAAPQNHHLCFCNNFGCVGGWGCDLPQPRRAGLPSSAPPGWTPAAEQLQWGTTGTSLLPDDFPTTHYFQGHFAFHLCSAGGGGEG